MMLRSISKSKRAGHPSKRPRSSKPGRMLLFAGRVKRALKRNSAVPSRRRDLSLIGDLAELELRVFRLRHALNALVSTPRSRTRRQPFDQRLMALVSEIDSAH